MSIFDQVNEDIKSAMKNREEGRLRALRGIKSALLLAKTEKGAEELNEEKEMQVLGKLLKQRKESFDIYTQQNRADLAEVEAEEIVVIEKFLPKQMEESEVRSILQQIIASTGASGPQDMGKVMGVASKQLAGKADGKMISTLVKTLLSGE